MSIYLPKAYTRYGASMGRDVTHAKIAGNENWRGAPTDATPRKFRLAHMRLNGGGYDSGGAYWGAGLRLYQVSDDSGDVCYYIRAHDRTQARTLVQARYTAARFYR